jgi:hypothetical protein
MRFGMGLGFGLGAQSQRRNNDMILVYAIPAAGTPIQLAIQANSTYFPAGQSVNIDWGDGSAAQTVYDTGVSTYIGHTYTAAGTYKIKISGSMTMYGRHALVDIAGQELLTRIDSFGKLGIASLAHAFYKCTGLASVPKTVPDSVTNMSFMFRFCSGDAFNPDVSNWNVRNVTNMRDMFNSCNSDEFNPDVSNWNVSNVTDMRYMFRFCSGDAFNPDMESWTLKTGVTTTAMFTGSRAQPTEWLDELLVAWAGNPNQGNNITIDFSPNSFSTDDDGEPLTAVAAALAILEGKWWTIATANLYSST